MAEQDVLIHTFLDGETMMLRIIWHGQVLQCGLSLSEICSITETIAAWQRVTLQAIAARWTSEKAARIVEEINSRERADLDLFRRQVEATEAEVVARARAQRHAEQHAHDLSAHCQRREEEGDAP